MKRIYEGASALTVVFYLIIVIGGFLFGAKNHYDKSKERRKAEKTYEKQLRQREEWRENQWQEFQKKHEEIEKEQWEEIIYRRKLEDPCWHYYDEIKNEIVVKPGDMNGPPPPNPYKEWDYTTNQFYYRYPDERRR